MLRLCCCPEGLVDADGKSRHSLYDLRSTFATIESYRESRRAVHVSRPSKNATGHERLG
jgi:hypothetical protein